MASSSRTLGRGRVLGSGRTQQPATSSPAASGAGATLPPPPPQGAGPPPRSPLAGATSSIPDHVRKPSLLSPSESSLSLVSQPSSRSSNEDPDNISAAVAQQTKADVATARAGSRLVCPICNEGMVTLLQLNRHLDDSHKDIQEEEQDEIQTWFKSQVIRAKKFQPLAVLNQKLKGLDLFEENEERRPLSNGNGAAGTASATAPGQPSQPVTVARVDPDEFVTKEHWQRATRDGTCSDPMCSKRLGGGNGNINCRHCGKLFCEEHTMYQMKLARSARHDPVGGYWCRVCETCYKSRQGYNDCNGTERDHIKDFERTRRKAADQAFMEVGRLEKRMTKLTQLLADPAVRQDQASAIDYIWSLSGQKSKRRAAEETVVDWEDDASVANCPFCQREFTSYSFKRHHCRLCGRVVCSDPFTACSSEVGLHVSAPASSLNGGTAPADGVPVDVRICKECKHTLFSRADFEQQVKQPRPDQRAFDNLKQFERGIRIMLPRFQKLLAALQDPINPPTPAQLAEATKVRKRLTDSFTQYDVAARRIRDMPSTLPTQLLLQKQVYQQAASFLHLHMLPLKSLPKILKHASPHGAGPAGDHLSPNGYPQRGPLAAIKRNHSRNASGDDSTSQSSRISSLETEEKQLREQLIVLEEQKFMVSEMVADAQRRRKFEEVESLGRNLDDLTREVDRVQNSLEGLKAQFEGVYTGG